MAVALSDVFWVELRSKLASATGSISPVAASVRGYLAAVRASYPGGIRELEGLFELENCFAIIADDEDLVNNTALKSRAEALRTKFSRFSRSDQTPVFLAGSSMGVVGTIAPGYSLTVDLPRGWIYINRNAVHIPAFERVVLDSDERLVMESMRRHAVNGIVTLRQLKGDATIARIISRQDTSRHISVIKRLKYKGLVTNTAPTVYRLV